MHGFECCSDSGRTFYISRTGNSCTSYGGWLAVIANTYYGCSEWGYSSTAPVFLYSPYSGYCTWYSQSKFHRHARYDNCATCVIYMVYVLMILYGSTADTVQCNMYYQVWTWLLVWPFFDYSNISQIQIPKIHQSYQLFFGRGIMKFFVSGRIKSMPWNLKILK